MSSQLSCIVNGVATILMFGFVDPYLSFLTDDVAGGRLDLYESFRTQVGPDLKGTAVIAPARIGQRFHYRDGRLSAVD